MVAGGTLSLLGYGIAMDSPECSILRYSTTRTRVRPSQRAKEQRADLRGAEPHAYASLITLGASPAEELGDPKSLAGQWQPLRRLSTSLWSSSVKTYP